MSAASSNLTPSDHLPPAPISPRRTLSAGERLKRDADIEALFRTGKALSVFPLRLLWKILPVTDGAFPTKAGFTAPKKKFRRATDRNRVKRLLREAWRLRQAEIDGALSPGTQLHVFILYTDKVIPAWIVMESVMDKAVTRLLQAIQPVTDA